MAAGAATAKVLVKAADIKQAMLARWNAPEYAIMWEVGEATGAVQSKWADAVIMSCWPSRGLELHGVEIKVSRSDWRREAANPKKAEAIGKYCDRWWLHVAPGVIADQSELPPLWGWREFDGKRWITRKEAGLNPTPAPVDRAFLAALLRRADADQRHRAREMAEKMIEADRAAFEKRVDDAVAYRASRNDHAIKQVEALEEALGIKLSEYSYGSEAKQLGALLRVMQGCDPLAGWKGLLSIMNHARDLGDSIEEEIRKCGLAAPEAIQAAISTRTKKRA